MPFKYGAALLFQEAEMEISVSGFATWNKEEAVKQQERLSLINQAVWPPDMEMFSAIPLK